MFAERRTPKPPQAIPICLFQLADRLFQLAGRLLQLVDRLFQLACRLFQLADPFLTRPTLDSV